MELPKEIKEKIQQCATIECNRIIEKEKADDGIMPVLLKVQLCDDYEVGAQIATDHFTPIIAEKDNKYQDLKKQHRAMLNNYNDLTDQLKKVKGLLKRFELDKWLDDNGIEL